VGLRGIARMVYAVESVCTHKKCAAVFCSGVLVLLEW